MIVVTDVSEYALVTILLIMTEDREVNLVTFHSCTFKAMEFNYNMHDKELLTVFKAFHTWCHYLEEYHMSSPSILKICSHSGIVIPISIKQACLPWQPPFLQHISMAIIQQSEYQVFYNRDTLIELSLLWQSSSIWSLSVSYHWNLHSDNTLKPWASLISLTCI